MRCFAAIELSREVIDLSRSVQRVLVVQDPSWATEKWVAPENLHITVAFWGDLRGGDLRLIAETLRDAQIPQFALTTPRFDVRPRSSAAVMAWLAFSDESGRGDTLARTLASVPVECSKSADTRARLFVPHVTLARARRPHRMTDSACEAAREVLGGAAFVSVSVSSVTVFSSTLTSSGPRYERLESIDLGAS